MPAAELGLTLLLVALLAVGIAGLVHGTLGIGFPLVSTPIIALVTDVKTAILLTLAPTLTVNIISILYGGHWRESVGKHWPVAAFALVGSVLGTKLLIVADPAPFKLLLALIILVYLYTSSLRGIVSWTWIGRYPRLSGAGFGTLAGLMSGTVNVAVPVLIVYFTELGLTPLALVQSLNLCFLSGKLAQIGTFGLSGYLSQQILWFSLPLALTAAGALFAGLSIRKRVDAETYRRWLRKMLLLIAALLIAQFTIGLMDAPGQPP